MSRGRSGSTLPSAPTYMSRDAAAGSRLAIINRHVAAIGEVDHHESAAAEIAGVRIHDGQRQTGCDRGIDGVAAFFQNFDSSLRG